MSDHRREFIDFALKRQALAFGEFTTKAGRRSPYFFNTGKFDGGAAVGELGRFYAKTLVAAERERGLAFDMLFGPAYKGITLATATAIALADLPPEDGGRDIGFAFNRKEAKTHGDAGMLVGAPLKGRVVIIDDVLTDGASKRESVDIIRAAGADPVAVVIAMDRMERKLDDGAAESAVQTFEAEYGIPVISIANLDDLMDWFGHDGAGPFAQHADAVAAYRTRYRREPARAGGRMSARPIVPRSLGFVVLCVAATAASAQGSIYTCRDHAGHTLTSDRPIADCAGTMRELGPSGTVRREIAPPLTPEQQKAKDTTDRAKKQADEALREQHRRDVALLTAYQSEEQIEAARKRALADPEASIKTSQERLADLDGEKQTLAKEVESYKGKTLPPIVKRKVDDNQALVDDETASIKARNVEIVRINQRYDDDRKRYRELTAVNAKK